MYTLAFLAFLLAVAMHLFVLRAFPRWHLLDFPERYGLLRSRLPYPTGIISVLCFLLFYALFEAWTMQAAGVFVAVVFMTAVSFVDDRAPLPFSLRLSVQILAALVIFLMGTRIYSLTNPLEGLMDMPVIDLDSFVIVSPLFSNPSILGALFTVLWLGLTMNALNWFDGIPGQVSALSTIGFLTIGFLSLSERVGQPHLALLAFILAGVAFAALVFDFPPAKVLMGDTGAMFFGLMLGVLTIYTGGKVATAFLVLGVPLIDSVIVGFRRISRGRSPFKGNMQNEHLHHRLLKKGWTPRRIIVLTALIGAGFGTTALFLDTMEKFLSALVLFGIMLLLSWYSRSSLYHLIVYVPLSHADIVRAVLSKAGAGKIGKYDSCSFSMRGTGRFRPLKGAEPAIGSEGTIEEVPEERIEAVVTKEAMEDAIRAVRHVHPYEEPAIHALPMEDDKDFL
ncbi:MAG: hypothetical protein AAB489_03080 [Patescibacteria group bacterium]